MKSLFISSRLFLLLTILILLKFGRLHFHKFNFLLIPKCFISFIDKIIDLTFYIEIQN